MTNIKTEYVWNIYLKVIVLNSSSKLEVWYWDGEKGGYNYQKLKTKQW